MIPHRGMTKVETNLHKYEMRLLTYKSELFYDLNKCIGCLFCIKTCPKEAIQRTVEKGVEFNVVDMEKCAMCGICDYICPSGAFQFFIQGERKNLLTENNSLPKLVVTEINGKKQKLRKFIEGKLKVDMTKWTAKCTPCADVCPSGCLTLNEANKLEVNEANCIYCGNCERKCTALDKEGLFQVVRKRILYEGTIDEFSTPWNEIVKKLVSFEEMAKELKSKSAVEAATRVKTVYKHLIP
ncbi:MAG TPA: 4Fe-4S binding protein [Candidatus Deferrimicrobium sp.]|nr:4Fe-4S binding protein [Candidatus Deferrimicrobium sp.]